VTGLKTDRRSVILCVLLTVATVGAYWQVCHCQFLNFDDPDYVTENFMVQRGFCLEGWRWAFSTGHASNWHPLTWLSHMLDCQLYGLNPAAHHATNLLFHTLNSLLLFGLLKQMTGAYWRSAFVAALFALHPIHVESVAWVSERKDVLSTFFGLLTIWVYAAYGWESKVHSLKSKVAGGPATQLATRSTQHVSRLAFHVSHLYFLALLLFACSLMSKPMLVTLPFVLLLLDYWPLGRLSLPFQRIETQHATRNTHPVTPQHSPSPSLRLLLEKLPFLALSLASCVVTVLAQRSGGALSELTAASIGPRFANAVVSYLRYLRKILWPDDLAVWYPPASWRHWEVSGAVFILLALTLLALWAAHRRPYLTVGWLWFAGTLIPVIGLVQVGSQSMADRYAYIPSIGFFIAVSWSLCDLTRERVWRLVLSVAGACILLASAWLTALQVRYWQDSVSLFTRALAVTENDELAHERLGEALLREHKLGEAKAQFLSALRLAPRFAEAHYGLGLVLQAEDRPAETIAHWRIALQLKPGWPGFRNNFAWLLANLFGRRLPQARGSNPLGGAGLCR
jgi:tetratricopeptide (TPR) repeat protein